MISGKQFENRFKLDWEKSFPDSFILRLPDQMSGYKGSNNICDFICFNKGILYIIECKAHSGASIPFTKITQYDKLIEKSSIPGVRAGVILYLYDKFKVFYIPASTIKKMKEDGKKSVGIKAVEEGYNIIEIPSTKLRVFMDSDYTILQHLKEGE